MLLCMTLQNFESGTRNALLWRVPGQRLASQGLNERYTESIDIFPTLIEILGVEPISKCQHVDDPPTTLCLQGESYASEFIAGQQLAGVVPKQYAFSQWPYQPWGPNTTGLREGANSFLCVPVV